MDLLDFDAGDLYFDEPMTEQVSDCLEKAAQSYGESKAELYLLRAYFLSPQHPTVHVALYRYFYYQHRFDEALVVAERVINLFAQRLGLPDDFEQLDDQNVRVVKGQMVEFRFYLLSMKAAGYIEMRLDRLNEAIKRLKKVAEFDDLDRLGASVLVNLAEQEIERKSGIYRLNVRR